MGSNEIQKKKEHPRAHEREWVVVAQTNGRGRPAYRSGRLTLAAAEARQAELREAEPKNTPKIVYRPPAPPRVGPVKAYSCRRCSARVEASRQPRKCEACGLNERPRIIEAQAADRQAVA